jgi:hypothetical protein
MHGLPKVSLKPTMTYHSTAVSGVAAVACDHLTTPLDIPCHTGLSFGLNPTLQINIKKLSEFVSFCLFLFFLICLLFFKVEKKVFSDTLTSSTAIV